MAQFASLESMMNQGHFGPSSLPGMSTLDASRPSSFSPNLSFHPSSLSFAQTPVVNPYASSSPPLPSNNTPHMMGTTIMAVSFKGGVVMGADSRTSTGNYVANRVSDKISPVSDLIYCCRSGSAADTQAVSEIVKYYLSVHEVELGKKPQVKTAAHLFQDLCYQNKDRLLAGIIIGGYDEVEKDGSVYALPLGGSLVKQPYALGGSGSSYVYGFIDAHYKEGMSKEECEKFVATAISHAMARDGSSGGVVRLATITKDGVERKMVPGDKLPYLAEQPIQKA